MHGQNRGHATKFHDKISIRNAIHGNHGEHRFFICIDKTQRHRHVLTIQRQRGAGNRTVAQRADIDAHKTIEQPLVIPLEHLYVRQ